MKLVQLAIDKPVSLVVGVIFVLMFGIISLLKIPVQLTPDVQKPNITVQTTWGGGSPNEMESEIVSEQEDELKSIEGLREMTSESLEGRGTVVLEFDVGEDLDSALLRVSNRLDQVKEYPDDADQPIIRSVDTRGGAMAWFILKPLPGNDVDIYTYHDFAEDYLKPMFERVPGVASSNVFGGSEREMQVIFDPDALAARDVTLTQVASAIRSENDNYSGGSFDEGKRRYIVRTIGEYQDASDIESVVIARPGGAAVYVRDVARVELGYKDADYAVRQNSLPAIAINAQKETGANTIDVVNGLLGVVDTMNEGILAENGLYIENVYRETVYIKSALNLVKQNLLVGGILAMVVLMLFLRSGSSTIIIATAIPISIIGTFVIMALLGRTINVISLAGMSFAVGMVIDNAIVVLENIYRHMQMGKARVRAAYEGTVEVWGAVLASTLTTAAVFLPILFIKEQAGQLFRDIAIAISVSVILSLIVSVTAIPMASSRFMRVAESPVGRGTFSNLWGLLSVAEGFGGAITRTVALIMSRPTLRLGVVVGMTVGAIVLSWAMLPKTEYLPEGNRNLMFGILLPPPGYNLDELRGIGKTIEADLMPYIEAEPGSEEERALGGPAIANFFYVARGKQVFMGAIARDPSRVRELKPIMLGVLSKIPGMIPIVTQASLFERGLGGGRSIDIQITGPDMRKLVVLARQIFFSVMQAFPDAQWRPIPSLSLGNPELQIAIDRERASDMGITNEELGFMINALVDGAKVSDFQLGNDEIDLVLKGEDSFSSRTQDIADLMVHTPSGKKVIIGSLGEVSVTTGPDQINHFERIRTIAIQVIPTEEMPLETAIEIIDTQVLPPIRAGGQLGADYNILLSGTADELTVTRQSLQWNFLLAAVIAFLLMASLFESFVYPLAIMFSVPLASFGGVLGLFVLNMFTYQPLDVLTMLGFIILIGIVVNNAILIVHQSLNYMRAGGMERSEAIVEAVRTRIRPIFMSTLTSVFGMMPLVIFPGSGSELYRGLGSVVVGGLLVSTVFTLFLVPSVFSGLLGLKSALPRVLGGGEEAHD